MYTRKDIVVFDYFEQVLFCGSIQIIRIGILNNEEGHMDYIVCGLYGFVKYFYDEEASGEEFVEVYNTSTHTKHVIY